MGDDWFHNVRSVRRIGRISTNKRPREGMKRNVVWILEITTCNEREEHGENLVWLTGLSRSVLGKILDIQLRRFLQSSGGQVLAAQH